MYTEEVRALQPESAPPVIHIVYVQLHCTRPQSGIYTCLVMAEHNILLEEAERVKKDKEKEAEENKSARLDQIIFALNESISKQKALLDILNEEK